MKLTRQLSESQIETFLATVEDDFIPPFSERENYNRHSYAEKLFTNFTIVAEMDHDAVIALVAGYTRNIERKMSYISLVACLPEWRGEHYTSICIKEYIKMCRTLPEIHYIRTDTAQTNYIAQRFYESLGFKKWDGAQYFGNPHKVHYIMNCADYNENDTGR